MACFSQLFGCLLGPSADGCDGRRLGTPRVDWSLAYKAQAAPLVSVEELTQRFDNNTAFGVLVVANDPDAEKVATAANGALGRRTSLVYFNATAASILWSVFQNNAAGEQAPLSAPTCPLLDVFGAACAPETLQSLYALLRRMDLHGDGGTPCSGLAAGVAAQDRERPASASRGSTLLLDGMGSPSRTLSVASQGYLPIKHVEPIWFLTGASADPSGSGGDGVSTRAAPEADSGSSSSHSWHRPALAANKRKDTAAAAAEPCQRDRLRHARPALIVTFTVAEPRTAAETVSRSGNCLFAFCGAGRVRCGEGDGGGTTAVGNGKYDGGFTSLGPRAAAAAASCATTIVTTAEANTQATVPIAGRLRSSSNRQDSGATAAADGAGTRATAAAAGAGGDCPGACTTRPPYDIYGDLWLRRENVVLSALSHMVTAFTAGCGSVLYQNGPSIMYYGIWSPPPSPQAAGASGLGSDGSSTDAARGLLLLVRLFALQPAKLERMLADVLGGARVWKGIVQVPATLKSQTAMLVAQPDVEAANPTGPVAATAGFEKPISIASATTGAVGLPGGVGRSSGGGGPRPQPDARRLRPSPPQTPSTQPSSVVGLPGAAAAAAPLDLAPSDRRPTCHAGCGACGPSAGQRQVDASGTLIVAAAEVDLEVPSGTDGLGQAHGSLDPNPLATSVWGLMLETAEEEITVHNNNTSALNAALSTLNLLSSRSHLLQRQLSGDPDMRRRGAAVGAAGTAAAAAAVAATTRSAAAPRALGAVLRAPVVPSAGAARVVDRSESARHFVASSQLQLQLMQAGVSRASPQASVSSLARDSQASGRAGGDRGRAAAVAASAASAAAAAAVAASNSSDACASLGNLVDMRRVKSALGLEAFVKGAGGGSVAGAFAAAGAAPQTSAPRPSRCASRAELAAASATASVAWPLRSSTRVLTFAGSLKNTPSALQQALAAASVAPRRDARSAVKDFLYDTTEEQTESVLAGGGVPELDERPLPPQAAHPSTSSLKQDHPEGDAGCVDGDGDEELLPMSPRGAATRHPPRSPLLASATTASTTGRKSMRGKLQQQQVRTLASPLQNPTPAVAVEAATTGRHAAARSFPWSHFLAGAASASGYRRTRIAPLSRRLLSVGELPQMREPATAAATTAVGVSSASGGGTEATGVAAATAAAAAKANLPPAALSSPRSSHFERSLAGGWSSGGRAAAARAAVAQPAPPSGWSPLAAAAAAVWHEVTAVRTTDPVSGLDVIVTQSDVSDKVEAERHLANVAEVEHRLLETIFPRHVLTSVHEEGSLLESPGSKPGGVRASQPLVGNINKLATSHAEVTLLFADIQGFTPMCQTLEPAVVMAFLNDLFTRFDSRLEEFGVYKVETIGDCYYVAGGLIGMDEHGVPVVRARDSNADPLHAEKVLMFAKAMLAAASQVSLPTTGCPVRMRIGIHSGPVVSGIVGQRMPRFCLFGDTVNTASRMESTGVPGCIHVSEAARRLLPNEDWTPTGGIEVKGKGLMQTYLWAPPNHQLHGMSLKPAAAPRPPPAAAAAATARAPTAAAGMAPAARPAAAAAAALSGSAASTSVADMATASSGAGFITAVGAVAASSSNGGHGGQHPPYRRSFSAPDVTCLSAGGFAQVWPPLVSLESVPSSVQDLADLLLDVGK